MVCRCTSHEQHAQRALSYQATSHNAEVERLKKERDAAQREIATLTPDASKFTVIDAVEVGTHLVMKIRYASCAKCAFEGDKVLVFLHQRALYALRWRKIDPHFRDVTAAAALPDCAPPPNARFPPTKIGWQHALNYAESLK